MHPADGLLYEIAILISDEEQSEQETATLWPDQPSDRSQYEATMTFSNEE